MTNLKNFFQNIYNKVAQSILIKRNGELFYQIRHVTNELDNYNKIVQWMNRGRTQWRSRETHIETQYRCGPKSHWRNNGA